MNDQRQKETGKLIRRFVHQKRRHPANIIQTRNLVAQRRILVVITTYKITVLFGGNATLSMHLNAAWKTEHFTVHMTFPTWNQGGLLELFGICKLKLRDMAGDWISWEIKFCD